MADLTTGLADGCGPRDQPKDPGPAQPTTANQRSENIDFRKLFRSEKLGIHIEFTPNSHRIHTPNSHSVPEFTPNSQPQDQNSHRIHFEFTPHNSHFIFGRSGSPGHPPGLALKARGYDPSDGGLDTLAKARSSTSGLHAPLSLGDAQMCASFVHLLEHGSRMSVAQTMCMSR